MKTLKSFDIAVYGGAFNPPHVGHANAIIQADQRAHKVLVVPSYVHPFNKQMHDYEVRCDWMKKVTQALRNEGVAAEVSTVERTLYEQMRLPVYSWFLLRGIAEQMNVPGKSIALVIGEDVMEHFHSFKYADRIQRDFSVMIVKEQINLHSSKIREALKAHETMRSEWLAPGLSLGDYDSYRQAPLSSTVYAQ